MNYHRLKALLHNLCQAEGEKQSDALIEAAGKSFMGEVKNMMMCVDSFYNAQESQARRRVKELCERTDIEDSDAREAEADVLIQQVENLKEMLK